MAAGIPPWFLTPVAFGFCLGVGYLLETYVGSPQDRFVFYLFAYTMIVACYLIGADTVSAIRARTWRPDAVLLGATLGLVAWFLIADPYMNLGWWSGTFSSYMPIGGTAIGIFLSSWCLQRGRFAAGAGALLFWTDMSWLFWTNLTYLLILHGHRGVGIWGYWVS